MSRVEWRVWCLGTGPEPHDPGRSLYGITDARMIFSKHGRNLLTFIAPFVVANPTHPCDRCQPSEPIRKVVAPGMMWAGQYKHLSTGSQLIQYGLSSKADLHRAVEFLKVSMNDYKTLLALLLRERYNEQRLGPLHCTSLTDHTNRVLGLLVTELR